MAFATKGLLKGAVVEEGVRSLNPAQRSPMFGNTLETFQRKRRLVVGTEWDLGIHKRSWARAMRTLGWN
jgi:hypothetical protein